jgi:hypothetical protein
MTRMSKPDYVMAKLLYFLGRFTPEARLAFMRKALVEVSKLPGGYGTGVENSTLHGAPGSDISHLAALPVENSTPALPAPSGQRRNKERKS